MKLYELENVEKMVDLSLSFLLQSIIIFRQRSEEGLVIVAVSATLGSLMETLLKNGVSRGALIFDRSLQMALQRLREPWERRALSKRYFFKEGCNAAILQTHSSVLTYVRPLLHHSLSLSHSSIHQLQLELFSLTPSIAADEGGSNNA